MQRGQLSQDCGNGARDVIVIPKQAHQRWQIVVHVQTRPRDRPRQPIVTQHEFPRLSHVPNRRWQRAAQTRIRNVQLLEHFEFGNLSRQRAGEHRPLRQIQLDHPVVFVAGDARPIVARVRRRFVPPIRFSHGPVGTPRFQVELPERADIVRLALQFFCSLGRERREQRQMEERRKSCNCTRPQTGAPLAHAPHPPEQRGLLVI